MVIRLPPVLLLEMSVPSRATSRTASSPAVLLDLMRLAGVHRLESVYTASTALLTVHVDRARQDKSLPLR